MTGYERRRVQRAVKALVDPLAAAVLLVVLSPLVGAVAVWTLLDAGRPGRPVGDAGRQAAHLTGEGRGAGEGFHRPLALVGQHGVYCVPNRNPSKPALDLQAVTSEIDGAKQLIQSVMEELRKQREQP